RRIGDENLIALSNVYAGFHDR
ncbi:hypothetical protein V676_02636, partial [Staphylococcus argenteus]